MKQISFEAPPRGAAERLAGVVGGSLQVTPRVLVALACPAIPSAGGNVQASLLDWPWIAAF
jgi:hypothetical protein